MGLTTNAVCELPGFAYEPWCWKICAYAEDPSIKLPRVLKGQTARMSKKSPTLQANGRADVVEQVTMLSEFLSARQAWFNTSLSVKCTANDLSMQSSDAFSDRRSLLRIPLALMPSVENFHWSVDWEGTDPRLIVVAADGAAPDEVSAMAMMVDLYNMTNKLGQWLTETPWFALKDQPDVLATLIQGRANAPKAKGYQKTLQRNDSARLLLDTFLGSRVFNLSAQNRAKAGVPNVKQGTSVIMPVIDYFNHRFAAESFSIHQTPSPASMRVFGKPDSETGELFVRYNNYDPLDTYLFYGFVDFSAPWLNSVPLTLDTDDTVLVVEAKGGVFKGDLPPALRDLRLFMPQITHQDQHQLSLNKIVIPNARAPRALQRVLAAVLSTAGVSGAHVQPEVARLEERLLTENENYWAKLAERAADLSPDHPVHKLSDHALSHLAAYRQHRPRLT